MKRSLLNIAMAAFISCFAACSEEEIIATQDGTPKEVTVMAQVPTNPATRSVGVDNVIGDNQLRCILSVVNSADNSELTRIEKLVGADDTKISFTFTVGSDVDYNCLFWADYVDNNVSKSGERYADKYYNTTNLQGISVKVDADTPANNAKLFNNAAADAFYGVLPKAYIADSQTPSIALKRPFAKLNLKPEAGDEWANQITAMDIEFNMPGEFNMLTGKAAGSKTLVKATGVSKVENAYFSTFLFIENPETAKFNDDIKISFVKPGSETSETVTRTIKGGFNIKPNNEINGEANLSKEQDITVDVTVDGKPEDPNAPKVGDYFYADGTWGTDAANTNGSQAIGVIFHIESEDAPLDTDNYNGVNFTDNKVHGWVVTLTQSEKTVWSSTEDENHTQIEGVGTAKNPTDDYNGYSNTLAIATQEKKAAYNLCQNFTKPNSEVASTAWYLPAIGQLSVLKDNIDKVNESLEKIDSADKLPKANENTNYWSSSYNKETLTTATIKFYQLQYDSSSTTSFKFRSDIPKNKAGVVRAVLTF